VSTDGLLTVQSDIADFKLQELTIPAGATVTWTNLDEQGHTSTSGKEGIFASYDNFSWKSGGLELDESFSMTFLQPGVFPFTCRFHPWMNPPSR
jgi:plastocyanin